MNEKREQVDHWQSLMEQLGIAPREVNAAEPTAETLSTNAELTDGTESTERSSDDGGVVHASADFEPRPMDAAIGDEQVGAMAAEVAQISWTEASADDLQEPSRDNVNVPPTQPGRTADPNDSTSESAPHRSPQPQPTTDWDLLAAELGIVPSHEPDLSGIGVEQREATEDDNLVATPDRVERNLDLFDREPAVRSAAPPGPFGDGLFDETDESQQPTIAGIDTAADAADGPKSQTEHELGRSHETEDYRFGEENRIESTDRKKRKRRRRKVKPSRDAQSKAVVPADLSTSAASEADELDVSELEPAWLDSEEQEQPKSRSAPTLSGAADLPLRTADTKQRFEDQPVDDDSRRAARNRIDRTGSDEDDDDESGDLRPAHKQIPTWQEAVGCIIQANIEARSRRGDSSRGRGRSGGRR